MLKCAAWASTAVWTVARRSASASTASRSASVMRWSPSTSSRKATSIILMALVTLCSELASATGLRSGSKVSSRRGSPPASAARLLRRPCRNELDRARHGVRTLLLGGALASGACAVALEDPHDTGPEPPNFLVIVADDMGWSDIGALGGEIRTPSIDRLAADGTLVTSFYVAPTCAPTRAMLMTGVDHHEAGLGVQSGLRAWNQVGINYEGQLHDGVVTVAEALAAHGYQTFMTGKWHLANEHAQGPHNRGFQRSFALLTGGASHFADQRPIAPVEIPEYVRDGEPVHELPADFYSSTAYAGTLIDFLEQRDANAPFFAYLSFTAPHDPLHVPDEWLDRYSGAYADGPVATRRARAERQEALGLIPEGAGLWNYPRFPAWFPNHAAPLGRAVGGAAREGRPPHGDLRGDGGVDGRGDRAQWWITWRRRTCSTTRMSSSFPTTARVRRDRWSIPASRRSGSRSTGPTRTRDAGSPATSRCSGGSGRAPR